MRRDDDFSPGGALRSIGYRLVWGCATFLYRAANACTYLAAGLLNQRDFRTASRRLWRDYRTLREDVDSGLEGWERSMYDAVLQPKDRVLLIGCGAGRDLLALVELGYQVTGLDPTPELVAQARQQIARRGGTATVHEGFVETAELDGPFDVVILAGNCYSFVQGAAVRIGTLTRIKAKLGAKGRAVITYTGALKRPSAAIGLTEMVSRIGQSDWRPERGDIFFRDYFANRLIRYEHMFAPGEVARECEAAGFGVVQDVTGAAYYVVAVPREPR